MATDLFELEWRDVSDRKGEWEPRELEFPDVSAVNLSNNAISGSEICAFDAFESYGNHGRVIRDWMDPKSGRFLVWSACRTIIRNGETEDRKGFDGLVSVRRIFLVEDRIPRDELNDLLIVVWAQLMVNIKVAIVSQGEYRKRFSEYFEAFATVARVGPPRAVAGYPDYLVIRTPAEEGQENVKCIGWIPERIWYPDENRSWPCDSKCQLSGRLPRGPAEHFEDVWEHSGFGKWQKGCKYDPLRVAKLLSKLFDASRDRTDIERCERELKELDHEAFVRDDFQALWREQIGLLRGYRNVKKAPEA